MTLYIRYFIYISLILFSTNGWYCNHINAVQQKDVTTEISSEMIEVREFIIKLRDAVNMNDKDAVANLANCTEDTPCLCHTITKFGVVWRGTVKSKNLFLKNYDKIITQNLKASLNDQLVLDSIWQKTFHYFNICSGCIWFRPGEGINTFNRCNLGCRSRALSQVETGRYV